MPLQRDHGILPNAGVLLLCLIIADLADYEGVANHMTPFCRSNRPISVGPDLDQVKKALLRPLPGLRAQLDMAIRPATGKIRRPEERRVGAVLILLYPSNGELTFPLTRRTETVENHKGQISLPGGAREPEDASLSDTALRETKEELGVEPRRVELLGRLSSLYIPPSNYCIHPRVGYTPVRPDFRPDPREVAEILEMSVSHLLNPASREEEVWTLRGRRVTVPFYRLGPHKVWGATAMVLHEFETILRAEITGIEEAISGGYGPISVTRR